MRYVLLGEPRPAVVAPRPGADQLWSTVSSSAVAVKLLRVGAFAQTDVTSGTCNLRVYFVDDTVDTFEVKMVLDSILFTRSAATLTKIFSSTIGIKYQLSWFPKL
jgi:hypothetical protein